MNAAFHVMHGESADLLALTMPDNSVDAIVCDPPYGLSFMGRKWDYDVPTVALWAECLRVLKPGGHLLAFAGTRTQHRMAVNIEDAGFEVRDMIAWVYGSGFPKSLDVSKAIDKANGDPGRLHRFTEYMRSTGLTAAALNAATGTNMGGHYLTAASQPAIPTPDLWARIRPLIAGDVPAWVDELVERVEAEREVVGRADGRRGGNFARDKVDGGYGFGAEYDVTLPATDAARQWQGWGTALKPALEPITVARKPLAGVTVADNVLAHGTGAINIDLCRVGDEVLPALTAGQAKLGTFERGLMVTPERTGRWPANLIHDGSEEVLAGFPDSAGQLAAASMSDTLRAGQNTYGAMVRGSNGRKPRGDLGSAARFFYCAKASKKDRDDGLGGMPTVTADPYGQHRGRRMEGNDARIDGRPPAVGKNHHPTVKPTDLMRYLCRLVTPPGGTVLDPFCGSGSTGRGALLEGFKFIGIEREAEYVEIARARIAAAVRQSVEDLL